MFPHYHILIALLLGNLLNLPNNILFLFIFGSILPDFDILLGLYLDINHRALPTHYPFLWFVITFLALLVSEYIFWICLAGFVHLLIDLIDWEIYLLRPFSNNTWSLISLDFECYSNQKSVREFLIAYYSTSWLLLIEMCTFFLFIVIVLLN